MELSDMEQLVDLVKRSNVRELTLRQGESKITLKKNLVSDSPVIGGDLVPYNGQESDGGVEDVSFAYEATDVSIQPELVDVIAPLVGIFHNVKPIVGVGSRVKAGQVVAAIEAMKLITEVTSPANELIVETLIEEGMPAEYGQALFLVEPGE